MVMTNLVYIVDTLMLLAVINYQQTGITTSSRDNSAKKNTSDSQTAPISSGTQ